MLDSFNQRLKESRGKKGFGGGGGGREGIERRSRFLKESHGKTRREGKEEEWKREEKENEKPVEQKIV